LAVHHLRRQGVDLLSERKSEMVVTVEQAMLESKRNELAGWEEKFSAGDKGHLCSRMVLRLRQEVKDLEAKVAKQEAAANKAAEPKKAGKGKKAAAR
jgi:hypothetical protein